MSQQNVDAFRGAIEAINERGPEAGLDLFDPEVEFYEDPKFPEAEVFRGRDEVVGNFHKFTESFEHYRFEIEDLRDAGGDKVMAVLREKARGKTSGVEVERRSGWVYTFRDGKALRVEIYLDPGDALEAVGLAEKAMSQESTTPDLVELARETVEAGGRRDLDAMLSFYAPDAVWDMSTVGMGEFEGLAAIRGFLEDWFRSYAEMQWEAEEIRDLGNGVTLAVVVQAGRLVGSTAVARVRSAGVYIWTDGLVERVTNYSDIDEARAAAERLAESRG